MTQQPNKKPVQNLKSEINQETDERGWFELSSSTWVLIGGLTLFNVGCLFSPNIIDGLFRILDFRLWKWWYFVALLLTAAFSIKWFFLYQSWNDLDSEDLKIAKQFLLMSVTITVEMAIFILLYATGGVHYLYMSLMFFFKFSVYSHMAALALLLLGVALAVTIYVIKEWLTIAFSS